ncbi:hypothetical protein [Bacillus toyonensis]|uniref:hypothetical protein n=1 Tax=Bacillus toyonensis TaxID=155322 RepID=UPI000BF2400E|nr:hypothetical protein [Bacillus toyonensis]PEL24315.1 hypothetical protein CN624_18160 [Bacillus toyonensis]
MLPLNQHVTVYKSTKDSDDWGIPIQEETATKYKVRLDFNGTEKFIQMADGKEVIYSAIVYFRAKDIPTLDYNDLIEYSDGRGSPIKATPRVISPLTDLSGKILYFKVIL